MDKDGNHLMGESGEIIIPTDVVDVVMDETGGIYGDGNYMDTLVNRRF